MPGVGGGARRSVLGVLSRLRVKKFGPSTSGGLPGRSLAPFGLWPPPTPRAPPRMALLGAIWSCRRAQMGSMLPLEHGWVLWTSHGRGVPLKTPWWCQMLRYRRGLDGIRPASRLGASSQSSQPNRTESDIAVLVAFFVPHNSSSRPIHFVPKPTEAGTAPASFEPP